MLAGTGKTKGSGVVDTSCCGNIPSLNWVTGSVNGCTVLGVGTGIGRVGF